MLTRFATTTRTITPTVSVVIPTFNEAGNADELLRRLAGALPAGAEVVVVDDSTDDTADRTRAAAPAVPFALTVIHPDETTGGLRGRGGGRRARPRRGRPPRSLARPPGPPGPSRRRAAGRGSGPRRCRRHPLR